MSASSKPIPRWTVITKPNCPYCDAVKTLMTDHGLLVTYVDLQLAPGLKSLLEFADLRTAPQVWKDNQWMGGFESVRGYLNGND